MTGEPPLDEVAFEALFRRLERPVYNVVYRWLWSAEEAHEVVQESFVRLWRARRRVRMETIEPYLFRIALNLAARRRRWLRRWRFVGLEGTERRPAADPDAQALLESGERERLVRAAVEALPEHQRRVVMLCELSGMTYDQVAETLGIAPGTVGSRRHAALKHLRRLLGEEMERPDAC